MDLDKFCKKHGYCSYIVWYAGYAKELSCQVNLGGSAWGPYGEKVRDSQPAIKMGGSKGKGLAGRAFINRDGVLHTNAQEAEGDSDEEKKAAEFAKECGIASSWAIFRDGAVYEFCSATKMDELPHEVIDTIGGSSGVAAAAKAVLAVVRLGALAKKSKKEQEA